MTEEQDVESELHDKKAEYDIFMKKWRKAREKWGEWEKARLDFENELTELGIHFEEITMENDTWHQQRRIDFNPIYDGKNPKLLSAPHSTNWETWECTVQCPHCKKYNVQLQYKKTKGMVVSASGAEAAYRFIDLHGINSEKVGDFWYCKKCAKEVIL
jgi:hypothetical protein